MSYDKTHRDVIANILSTLLKEDQLKKKKFFGLLTLNATLKNLLDNLILKDEKVTVYFSDVISNVTNISSEIGFIMLFVFFTFFYLDRWLHPLFGCTQHNRVFEISCNTLCEELIPTATSFKKLKRQHEFETGLGGISNYNLDEV